MEYLIYRFGAHFFLRIRTYNERITLAPSIHHVRKLGNEMNGDMKSTHIAKFKQIVN